MEGQVYNVRLLKVEAGALLTRAPKLRNGAILYFLHAKSEVEEFFFEGG